MSSLTVLVVDANPSTRAATLRLLQDASYAVVEASSGSKAIDLLCRQPGVDLVLKDHDPPHSNAVHFIRRLREAGQAVPVIGECVQPPKPAPALAACSKTLGRAIHGVWGRVAGKVCSLSRPSRPGYANLLSSLRAAAVLSALNNQDVVLRCLSAGAADVYPAPLSPATVAHLHVCVWRQRAAAKADGPAAPAVGAGGGTDVSSGSGNSTDADAAK